MKEKIKPIGILSIIFSIFYFIPGPKLRLYDVISGSQIEGFKISWSFWRYLLEPFVGLEEYILSFVEYMPQLISWMLWLLVFAAAIQFIKNKFNPALWNPLAPVIGGKRGGTAGGRVFKGASGSCQRGSTILAILKKYSLSLVSAFTLLIFVLLVSLPSPKLTTPKDHILLDFHSHTFYSYDGAGSPSQNLRFHNKMKYDYFFITEQQHADSLKHFPETLRYKKIFPGMQMRAKEGNALLVLADKYFVGKEFKGKTNKEMISLAHSKGFFVICPHWWKWRVPELEELYEAGVDGFEIYNPGYRDITKEERRKIINFCLEKNLLMTSATDWHGWGSMSNVWTVVKKPEGDVFQYLKSRPKSYVMVYRRNEIRNSVRYIFEPFFAVYYYFSSICIYQFFGWLFWIILIFSTHKFLLKMRFIIPGILFFMAVYYFILSLRIEGNETLLPLMVPVLSILSIGWTLLLRKKKNS